MLTGRLSAARSAGTRSARMLLVLAMVAGAFTLTVARAEPAEAYTVQRSAHEIVITSERLHDLTVRTTQIITLRSNGDILYRIEAHNGGRTRKYFSTRGSVTSPATNIQETFNINCKYIPKRTYDAQTWQRSNPTLALRWNEVVNDPNLSAYFRLDATRTSQC